MIEISATHKCTISLGHTGENAAVRVAFSLLPFQQAFPGGRPALLVRRPKEETAYPVPLDVDGASAYWTVSAADTEATGFGQAELQWYLGQTLAKSDKFQFFVAQALTAGAEPPDEPTKRWFDAIERSIGNLDDLTTTAKDSLVAAINEAARTGGGAAGVELRVSGGYIQYSTDGAKTWSNLITVEDLKGDVGEKGDPGENGVSPTVTTSKSGKVTTVTVTDADGEHSFEVLDGADGSALPTVTDSDNGKFLRVASGVWAAVSAEQNTADALIVQSTPEWEVGGINSSTGADQTRSDRLRCGYIALRNLMGISFDTIELFVLVYKDTEILGNVYGAFVDAVDADYIRIQYPAATQIRLVAKNAVGTDILPEDAASVVISEYRSNTLVYPELDAVKTAAAEQTENILSILHTTKELMWEQGTINATTGLDKDSTARIRCGYTDFANIVEIAVTQSAQINIFAYDARKNALGDTGWLAANVTKTTAELKAAFPGIRYVRLCALSGDVSYGDKIAVTVISVNDSMDDFKTSMLEKTDDAHRFDSKFQVIAYSNIGVAPINTKEHFEYCAKHGFDGLKCDVRITSDDKLVLCHDAGFTLDANGRITTYSVSSSTAIRSMTYDQVVALEHAQQYNGQYCHPTDLDTFLTVCKRNGKLPYITVRGATDSTEDGTLAPTVAKLVAEAIRKFSVERNCIVNSYDPAILLMIRAIEPEVYLSQVFYPYNETLRTAALKNAKENELYMLCLFFQDATNDYDTMVADANILAMISECKTRGIRVWGAQTTEEATLDKITALGFGGTHHKKPLTEST